jgi:hypothetical protein
MFFSSIHLLYKNVNSSVNSINKRGIYMGLLDVVKDALGGELGIDPNKVDLPVSGDAAEGLNKLISNGTFSNKNDFVTFLAKTYMKNDLGSAMSGGQAPPESMIMGIIDKTGIAKGFTDTDKKKMLVPLLIAGFMTIYRMMSKKKTMAKPR